MKKITREVGKTVDYNELTFYCLRIAFLGFITGRK